MKLLITLVVAIALVNISFADETVAKTEEKTVETLEKTVEEVSESSAAAPIDLLKPKRAKSPINPLGQNRLNSNIGRADTRVESTTTVPPPPPAPRVSNSSPVSFKISHALAFVPALVAVAKLF